MAGTPAVAALEKAKIDHRVCTYEHDPGAAGALGGYGLEAAHALGVDASTVFKTLVVQVESSLVVAICPVTGKLDLKAVAQAVGAKKASMADPAAAQKATGYVVGGISPLGQRKRLRTVLDATAMDHPQILVSAGRRGMDVALAPSDLVQLTSAVVAPIAAGH